VHETTTFLLVFTLPTIHRFKQILNSAINLFSVVINNQPHLKYMATLPCVILILMFHTVVWQHMQGVAGFLIMTTAKLPKNVSVKNFENRLRFDRIMAMSLCLSFLAHPVLCAVLATLWTSEQSQCACSLHVSLFFRWQ